MNAIVDFESNPFIEIDLNGETQLEKQYGTTNVAG